MIAELIEEQTIDFFETFRREKLSEAEAVVERQCRRRFRSGHEKFVMRNSKKSAPVNPRPGPVDERVLYVLARGIA